VHMTRMSQQEGVMPRYRRARHTTSRSHGRLADRNCREECETVELPGSEGRAVFFSAVIPEWVMFGRRFEDGVM
jgi:hypothetical protein